MVPFFYSWFHITLPRGIANFVGKLGTSLRSSQLRGELDNQIANFGRTKLRKVAKTFKIWLTRC